jgi:hypothetical protein
MHVLHACLDVLRNPLATTLKADAIESILADEYKIAKTLLVQALAIDDPSEPEKYILNTYALLNFNLADAKPKLSQEFSNQFSAAIDLQEEAIGFDALDALARYQFVHEIFENVPDGNWSEQEKLDLFARAEIRLQELLKINEEKTIKNIDPVDAEVQIALLFDLYEIAVAKITNFTSALGRFKIKHPEAALALGVRQILGKQSLGDAFAQPATATRLRELRSELMAVPDKSARSLLLQYRMYLDDPKGRTQFDTRLNILAELKRKSLQQYLPYWHDEAALLFQIDNFSNGAERFAQLRAFRRGQKAAQASQYFWTNERALLRRDGSPELREVVLTVGDASHGIATFRGTGISTRYQTYQFPELKDGQVFRACIRFTLAGPQAISETLARTDLEAMSLR